MGEPFKLCTSKATGLSIMESKYHFLPYKAGLAESCRQMEESKWHTLRLFLWPYCGEVVSKALEEKSVNSRDLISWRLWQLTTFLVPDRILLSIAWLFYNIAKICITKVVCAGISTGNSRVENCMGNLSRKTYLGWEQAFLGFKHRV